MLVPDLRPRRVPLRRAGGRRLRFLPKDAGWRRLVAAVRSIAAGNATIDTSLTKRVLREVVARRGTRPVVAALENGRATDLLTAREAGHPAAARAGDSERGDRRRAHPRGVDGEVPPRPEDAQGSVSESRLQAAVWAYQNRIVEIPG